MRLLVLVPLSKWRAWDRFGSSFTSQEHTVCRVERPKVLRKYVDVFPSAMLTALDPFGYPLNLLGVLVACDMTSNNISARILRGTACEKFSRSVLLVSLI